MPLYAKNRALQQVHFSFNCPKCHHHRQGEAVLQQLQELPHTVVVWPYQSEPMVKKEQVTPQNEGWDP